MLGTGVSLNSGECGVTHMEEHCHWSRDIQHPIVTRGSVAFTIAL